MGVKVTGQFEPAGEFPIVDAKDVSGNITGSFISASQVTLGDSNFTGNMTASGDFKIQGSISGSVTSTGSFGRLEIAGDSSILGDVTIGGNINIGDSDTDSLTISADLTSNLIPNADSTFNLGSPTKNWKEGYIEELSSTNITASGDISGSGISTGSLAYLSVDNKIGIGIKSPKNSLHISATDGIIIPVGNTSQRTSDAVAGEIRFNSQQNTYEGYDGANWGTLGGVVDVDQDTKITAENSAGDDNDQLRFFTSGIERLRINSDGHISASVDITSSGTITAHQYGGNISGSATSTGSFGRVVTTDLLASGESTLKNKVILKHDSSNAILELRSTGGSRINEFQNFNASQIYNSLFLNSNEGIIAQDGTYSGGNTRAAIFSIGHIDGTLYHQFGNENQVAKQTGMGIIDYDTISGSAVSTGSFGYLTVDGMSNPNLIEFSSSISSMRTTDSSSISSRLTTEEANVDALQVDSASFSARVTAITSSISALKLDSGSFSTRVAKNEGTGSKILAGQLEFANITFTENISGSSTSTGSVAHLHISNNIGVGTLSPLATVHISASDGLIIPVGNTSQRNSNAIRGEIRFNTQIQTYEGYDGNNWGSLGGMNDVDQDTKITAETSAGADNDELQFFTAGTERLRIFADGHISASGNITASKNLQVDGDVTTSVTSTGSFGMIKKDGLDIREHFSRNTVEAFELDSNGDFQPTEINQYVVDPKWELDEDGNLQRRERELWTFDWDSYFSD